MNELEEAFAELQEAKAEATGKREIIILNGRSVEALVSEITQDEENISGGIAQAGGFHCQVACSKFAQDPKKGQRITVRGKKFSVLSFVNTNGVTYDITAGDLAKEAR